MAINQNQALFALLGTTFGGNGQTTFALPDLRSRVPIGQGNGPGLTPRTVGQAIGEEAHTPAASHTLQATEHRACEQHGCAGTLGIIGEDPRGRQGRKFLRGQHLCAGQRAEPGDGAGAIGHTGGQPHSNLMPYLAVNACIALVGVFPSRNYVCLPVS